MSEIKYVYITTAGAGAHGNSLHTVGHYDPDGKWHAESDHDDTEAAAARIAWLNGGSIPHAKTERENVEAAFKLLSDQCGGQRAAIRELVLAVGELLDDVNKLDDAARAGFGGDADRSVVNANAAVQRAALLPKDEVHEGLIRFAENTAISINGLLGMDPADSRIHQYLRTIREDGLKLSLEARR